ncbi:MAG TPA: adenylate/guanylate cyclase domain-containing protein [Candidatus Methylacidiphilales bacterium]|nr:adenylate/guanylate cyclase domain-containing protein [Candidatus Methylacidiphilales bacterium]
MKSHATTFVAAIFALFLTAIVALLPYIPFFAAGEATAGDVMMQLRHKFAPHPPDPHIIFVPIDATAVQSIQHWPIPRRYYGRFLQDVAAEKPKVVAWDLLFVDPSPDDTTSTPANGNTTANPAPSAAPLSTLPSPPTSTAPDRPASDSTTVPSSNPVPAPAAPAPAPGASATPVNPPASSPSSNTPTPSATNGTSQIGPIAFHSYGLSLNSTSTPVVVADDPNQTASPSSALSTPDTSTASAPPSSPSPSVTNETSSSSPALPSNDEALTLGASLFNNMVTSADRDDSRPSLTDEALLPTRPLKQVRGDISHLLFSRSAEIPIPSLRKVSYFGFADQDTSGNTRRTMPLVVNIGGKILPSLDLQILLQYWDIDPDKVLVDVGHEIVLTLSDGSQTHIPIDQQGFLNINYRAESSEFKQEEYVLMMQDLEDKAAGKLSAESDLPPLKDNIVVVGVTLTGTDAVGTPLQNVAPGVITHLNVLNNILQRDFLRQVDPWIWLPVYAIFLFITGNLMLRIGIAPLIPAGLLAIVLQFVVSYSALWLGNFQIPLVCPVAGILLLGTMVPTRRFWGTEREKALLRSTMRAYLSEKVMTKVLEHPDNVKLGGVKQEITVMFCDIRGFTKYCDNRDSGEVLDVLNEYMEEMTQVVFKYDGTVDKYIGDCIMAFWNAPDLQADHAQRAVCCAMEMRYALANFKTRRAGKDVELFECGIGIHTGEALVGNMGSTLKRNYTAMGSTVNLASRLETLTKRLNERILISEDTFRQLQGEFPLTDRGEAVVPGFAAPIHIYAVTADQDIGSALKIGRTLASQQEYTAEEASEPIWKPVPLPEEADQK